MSTDEIKLFDPATHQFAAAFDPIVLFLTPLLDFLMWRLSLHNDMN